MTNNIKLIAIDLDGTCLNSDGLMTERTREVLNRAGDRGIAIVYVTGRPVGGVEKSLLEINNTDYIISLNGSRIYSVKQKKTLFVKGICDEAVEVLKKLPLKYDVLADVFADNRGYCDRYAYSHIENYLSDEHFREYYKKTRIPIVNFWNGNFAEDSIVEKINMFFGDMNIREKVFREIEQLPQIKICSGMPNNIEVNHIDVNKGNALNILGSITGINTSEMFACGDGGNDIEMLNVAGIGVAMANARGDVRKAADFITLSNDNDGVAYAVEEFIK